jgi:hypothetical protein
VTLLNICFSNCDKFSEIHERSQQGNYCFIALNIDHNGQFIKDSSHWKLVYSVMLAYI